MSILMQISDARSRLTQQGTFMTGWQRQTSSRPIKGPYKQFAEEVRRVLGWDTPHPISTRDAGRAAGFSNATTSLMLNGDKVGLDKIRAFSTAYGLDFRRMAMLNGYILPEDMEHIERYLALPYIALPLSREVLGSEDDPFLIIGTEVDLSPLASLPFSEELATAGNGLTMQEQKAEYRTLSEAFPGGVRTIRVRGDCMEPSYKDGDILFIRPAQSAENGQEVIALVNGEVCYCKLYRQAAEGPYLEARNGDYPLITGNFEIKGIIEGYVRLPGLRFV